MQRWFVRDIDVRSNLIVATVQEQLSGLILTGSTPRIASYFNRMLQDERLYAVGLCVDEWKPPVATAQFPTEINCATLGTYAGSDQNVLRSSRGLLHVAVRSVDSEVTPNARLVLVHDMNFVERRSEDAALSLLFFVAWARASR
jgi:trehalose 6-phosphate synthase